MFICQILFMTCILLNFMIGVIMDVYEQVKKIEKLYIYNERALLNEEFY